MYLWKKKEKRENLIICGKNKDEKILTLKRQKSKLFSNNGAFYSGIKINIDLTIQSQEP